MMVRMGVIIARHHEEGGRQKAEGGRTAEDERRKTEDERRKTKDERRKTGMQDERRRSAADAQVLGLLLAFGECDLD